MSTTFSTYLEFDRASETRSEYVDGRIVPMPPGDVRHAVLVSSASAVVDRAVEHLPYVVSVATLRLQVKQGAACFYPDAMVFRDRPECFGGNDDVISNPAVIIEIGSEATDVWDRIVKFRNYRCVPSLREYVLVWPDEMCVECYTRRDNGDWIYRAASGPEATCALESIGVGLPLAAIYRKLSFLSTPAATPVRSRALHSHASPINRQSAIK